MLVYFINYIDLGGAILNQSTVLTALCATFLSVYIPVYADTKSTDACLADIQKQKPSEFVKLEKLNKNGKHIFSIEVRDNAGFEWEYTCDTKGKIINRQSEVSGVLMDAFKKAMKISEQSALAIALNVHPGKLKEVEYMICTNGSANYEFDISDTQQIDYKIEISAANGKIMEDSIQEWQIGEESEELK